MKLRVFRLVAYLATHAGLVFTDDTLESMSKKGEVILCICSKPASI